MYQQYVCLDDIAMLYLYGCMYTDAHDPYTYIMCVQDKSQYLIQRISFFFPTLLFAFLDE